MHHARAQAGAPAVPPPLYLSRLRCSALSSHLLLLARYLSYPLLISSSSRFQAGQGKVAAMISSETILTVIDVIGEFTYIYT
jgi:hypothetical protein